MLILRYQQLVTPARYKHNKDDTLLHACYGDGIDAVDVAEWLASETLDARVERSSPGLSVTCGCVPGQN